MPLRIFRLNGLSQTTKSLQAIAYILAYNIVAVLVLLGAIDYLLYKRYYSNLAARNPPGVLLREMPNASPILNRRVGTLWFNDNRISSYTNFDVRKASGTIRIGAFGDSFTIGDEVNSSGDFPTFLTGLLTLAGIKNIEVLNFGVNGHGFGETYLMWEELAKLYSIDVVILGPMTFFYERMTRFNSYREFPYYLHSRFVLESDGLRLIDVLGETNYDRFARYFSFVTPWRYVRYDRGDPPFLAALLPSGRTLGNPFYYSHLSEKDEAIAIERALILRMIGAGKMIILGLSSGFQELRASIGDLAGPQLCIANIEWPNYFPYRAPRSHNSPTGNMLVARQYMSLLSNSPVIAPVLISSRVDLSSSVSLPFSDMAAYNEVRIQINGVDAGVFVDPSGAVAPPTFLRKRGFRSLVVFESRNASAFDPVFIALKSKTGRSSSVRLVYRSSSGTIERSIGRSLESGGLNILVADIELSIRARSIFLSTEALSAALHAPIKPGEVNFFVGDDVVLSGVTNAQSEDTFLSAVDGSAVFFLRSTPGGDFAQQAGPQEGTIDMILSDNSSNYRLPLARWQIEHREKKPYEACSADWSSPLLSGQQSRQTPQRGQ